MSFKKSDEFKHKAVQLALTSGLSRKQIAADLGVGIPASVTSFCR